MPLTQEADAPTGQWPGGEERPFLGAILDDAGEIRCPMRTRQRKGAKYLLREVFD